MEIIRAGMKGLRLRELPAVEKATKIPLPTLTKIYYGTTKYPRHPTIKILVRYFLENARRVA